MIDDAPASFSFISVKQRSTSGKPTLYVMPKNYALLIVAPTEKYNLPSQKAGKIDQSLLDTLTHTTVAIDLLYQTLYLLDQTRNCLIFLQALHQPRVAGGKPLSADNCLTILFQEVQVVKDLLHQRAQRQKECIGLIHGEETGEKL